MTPALIFVIDQGIKKRIVATSALDLKLPIRGNRSEERMVKNEVG